MQLTSTTLQLSLSTVAVQGMTAALLLHKPAEPCKFLATYLTGLQSQGPQPCLTREELRVMFGMFDVTEKGVVSVAQANQVAHTQWVRLCLNHAAGCNISCVTQALKTLVGQGAELQSSNPTLRPDKTMGCEASC